MASRMLLLGDFFFGMAFDDLHDRPQAYPGCERIASEEVCPCLCCFVFFERQLLRFWRDAMHRVECRLPYGEPSRVAPYPARHSRLVKGATWSIYWLTHLSTWGFHKIFSNGTPLRPLRGVEPRAKTSRGGFPREAVVDEGLRRAQERAGSRRDSYRVRSTHECAMTIPSDAPPPSCLPACPLLSTCSFPFLTRLVSCWPLLRSCFFDHALVMDQRIRRNLFSGASCVPRHRKGLYTIAAVSVCCAQSGMREQRVTPLFATSVERSQSTDLPPARVLVPPSHLWASILDSGCVSNTLACAQRRRLPRSRALIGVEGGVTRHPLLFRR